MQVVNYLRSLAKPKKFTFLKETKLLFLQSIRMHDAHNVPHARKEKYFTKVFETLVLNMPTRAWGHGEANNENHAGQAKSDDGRAAGGE